MIMPGRIHRYVLEKLSSAASSLAIHPGRIKERLVYILDNYILGLDACCFPEPLRHRFNLIKAIVLANDKTTRETVESMTEDAACDLAKALTELADELLKLNERPPAVEEDDITQRQMRGYSPEVPRSRRSAAP